MNFKQSAGRAWRILIYTLAGWGAFALAVLVLAAFGLHHMAHSVFH